MDLDIILLGSRTLPPPTPNFTSIVGSRYNQNRGSNFSIYLLESNALYSEVTTVGFQHHLIRNEADEAVLFTNQAVVYHLFTKNSGGRQKNI